MYVSLVNFYRLNKKLSHEKHLKNVFIFLCFIICSANFYRYTKNTLATPLLTPEMVTPTLLNNF